MDSSAAASQSTKAGGYPSVSLVVPARNEARYVEQCIRSILSSDYPADRLEVIVVDGMSEDATGRIVRDIAREDPRVRYVRNPARITPVALNLGVQASKGEIVFIVGGHATVSPTFVRLSVRALQEHPEAWCAGGCIENISTNYIGRSISAAMSSPVGVGNALFRLGSHKGFVETVAYGAYWRWVFEKIGYFDEELVRNQDDDFNHRIIHAGGKIYLDSDIKSSYYGRRTLGKLMRQYYQYGFWTIRTLQKHGRVLRIRQIIPVLFVSVMLASLVSAFLWRPMKYQLAALAAVYGLALLGGVADVIRRKGLTHALLSPVVFVILHFGYGIGSLGGVWRFVICDSAGIPRLVKTLPVAIAVILALFAGIALADFKLESRISVQFLYFVPLALSVILLGRTPGILYSLCASALLLLEQLTATEHPPMEILVWNAVMRLGNLLVVCYLVDLWWRRRAQAARPVSSGRSELAAPAGPVPAPGGSAMSETIGQAAKELLKTLVLVYVPLAAVVYVDYAAAPSVSLAFFYSIPVILAVRRREHLLGGLFCALCASAAFFALQLTDNYGWTLSLWNTGMRFLTLLAIVLLTWRALARSGSGRPGQGQRMPKSDADRKSERDPGGLSALFAEPGFPAGPASVA